MRMRGREYIMYMDKKGMQKEITRTVKIKKQKKRWKLFNGSGGKGLNKKLQKIE